MNTFKTRPARSLAALVLSAALSAPAFASDDRENATPTGWLWRIHQTNAQVQSYLSSGWRLVDIEVETASPPLYTAAFVPNSGTFQKASWWLPLGTMSQLNAMLTANKARLTDVEVVDIGGTPYYSAIMEDNTGANAKAWWHFYDTSINGIVNAVTANGARVIDLEQYSIGGVTHYAAVAIKNSGADYRGWWWYFGASALSVDTALATNKAQPYCVERTPAGTFNVVMISSSERAWWFSGRTASDVNDLCGQYGSRVISADPYASGGTDYYTVVLLNNSSDLTVRVGDILRNGLTDGYSGLLLKKANGAVLASLNAARTFEPASLMKTVHHAHAMKQVALGNDNLATAMWVNTGISGSCPDDTQPVVWTLEQTLSAMMNASDNTATKAITLRYGMLTLNLTAGFLGMSDTMINHHIGCTGTPNRTTLNDIAKLHEQVINGYLGAQRQKFYEIMRRDYVNGGYAEGKLDPVMTQEAQKVGLSASQLATFRSYFLIAFKKGGYTTGNLHQRAWGGYLRIPFYSNGGIVGQEYEFGTFINDATDENATIQTLGTAAAELLRDELHAAMLTWKSHVAGSFTSFGSGCPGTSGVLAQTTSGTPELGQVVSYSVANGRHNATATVFLGGSKSKWGSLPLPLNLGIIGAPLCTLYVDGSVQLGLTLSSVGAASKSLTIPVNTALVGEAFYTQYVVLDAGANAANLALSNAQATVVGGLK